MSKRLPVELPDVPSGLVANTVRAELNDAARALEDIAELLESNADITLTWPPGGMPELSELAAGLRAARIDVIERITLTFERRTTRPGSDLHVRSTLDAATIAATISHPAARSAFASLDLAAGWSGHLTAWLGEQLPPAAGRRG